MNTYTANDLAAFTVEALAEIVIELQDTNASLQTDNDALAKGIDEANGTIASLNQIIASAKSNGAAPAPAAAGTPANAEHGGKVYVWKRKNFLLPGDPTRYTAEQANADTALLEKLLALEGQSVLVEQA